MSDALILLRLEHGNLAQVLDLADDELRRLAAGGPADASLLVLIHEYLEGYPIECHHPKEDLAYRKLQERDPERAAALLDLETEHAQLGQATQRIGERLRKALDEGDLPGGELREELRKFVSLYRNHMVREEREFFPAVLDGLTRDDLAEIDFSLFDARDHLFDRSAEARFGRLREAIDRRVSARRAESEAAAWSSPDVLGALPELRSVDRFNAVLGGRGFQLVAYRTGGYALERDGRWLLDIPECSETHAAWCATFFVAGIEATGKERDPTAASPEK
ncbi:MAG: hemerythrin domain-containing protein [Myxococcota bacterium]